jgi:hypothetical protein
VNDLVEGRLLKFGNNERRKQRTGNWLSYPISFTNLRSKTDSDYSSRHSATFPEKIGESLQGRCQGCGGVGVKRGGGVLQSGVILALFTPHQAENGKQEPSS